MTRRFLISLVLACTLAGCGTTTDLFGSKRTKRREDGISRSSKVSGGRVRVFGGVRYDCEVMAEGRAGWLLVLYFFDLPFSLAIDTVILPFTIPYNLSK